MYPLWQRGHSSPADKNVTAPGGSSNELTSSDRGPDGSFSASIGNSGKYRRMAASVGDMSSSNNSGNSNSRLYSGLSNASYASGRKLWPKCDGTAPSSSSPNGKSSLFNNIGSKTSSGSSSSLFPNKNSGLFNINSSNMPASSLNQQNNSLWNRRRTNSTINLPSAPVGEQDRSPSSKPAAKIFFANGGSHNEDFDKPTRGSSTSPRTPHSRGFWLQHPDDLHQQWVKTDTPDVQTPPSTADSSASTLTWPRGASLAGLAKDTTAGDARLAITEGDDEETSVSKSSGDAPATLPRVYKSQATWVST
ncbi:hypothetical protein FHG87_015333 [Trinorchestia longiramus]|nr:hypothetical protein FHG87_015333 [Trinorchestia longiramus]